MTPHVFETLVQAAHNALVERTKGTTNATVIVRFRRGSDGNPVELVEFEDHDQEYVD